MDKSEYHQYLASREWALIKEQLRKRSRGRCERCWEGKYESTHHITYERTGHELLTDLLAVCNDCHKFLSGKSNTDPLDGLLLRNAKIVLEKANDLSSAVFDFYESAERSKIESDPDGNLGHRGATWQYLMQLNEPFSRFREAIEWFVVEEEAIRNIKE